jgi:ABC-type transporter Mla subunit MlaD
MGNTYVMDGKNYVEVERKAKAGETVIIVDADDLNGDGYANGNTFIIGQSIEGSDLVDTIDNITLFDAEYRVLEPVADSISQDVTDLLANLARRVSSLEQQLSATQANVEKLAEELATLRHQTQPKEVEVFTFEKFLDSIADKVAERLVGQSRMEGGR